MVKRTPADSYFSKCVRARANWTCEYCGIDLTNDRGRLHCSHFISRSYHATRYHPLNAFAHCSGCHQKLGGGRWGGGNVAEFAAHYDDVYGSENRELMRALSKLTFLKHKHHVKPIADHYRLIYRDMEQRRRDGEDCRIEFDEYPELTTMSNKISFEFD